MAADYTRTIVFKVEDQAIKRATERITQSLERIEKSLNRIERKGFHNIARGANEAAKGVDRASSEFKLLNEELKNAHLHAGSLEAVLKRIANTGLRGNILRNRGRSRAGRAGSGFGEWSARAGEYNPYAITSPKEGNPWHNIGGPPRSHLMGSLDPISKSIARHTKKIAKDTAKLAQIGVKSQRAAAVPSPIVPGVLADPRAYAPGTAGPARRPGSWQNMFSMGRGGAGKGLFGATGGSRLSNMVSSGMIGGGFPLLFGQGGLAAAGGGLGGILGGALGGGFGFGLSIVGTAIASRISEGREFEKQITKVNAAIKATGSTSTFTSKSIKNLGKVLGMSKDEALQAAQSFAQFDAAMRTSLLVTFGDEATFNLVKGLKTNVDLVETIQQAESKIGREKADQLLQMLKVEGSLKVQKKLQEEIMKVTKEQQKGTKRTNFLDWMNPFRGMLEFGHKREDGTIRAMTPSELQAARERKFEEQTGVNRESGAEQLDTELNRAFDIELITRIASVRDEIEKLTSPMYMLTQTAQTVGDSFGESFKGIIKGSLTAQQALANLFQKTADMFLDMAAQMIAKQIQMKILGIGLNFMGGGFGGGSNMGGGGYYNPKTGEGTAGPNFGLADGGTAQGGKTYLVGERGPELFVPGKTGTVVPNHELGGGGNISVNVAVDASGSSAQGDEPNAQELGRLIGAAVQSELVRQKRPGGILY